MREGPDRTVRAFVVRGRPAHRPLAGRWRVVITSYSIHYTKLYEGLTTSVTCCELPTSVKTVIDQDNDVISVRVTNRSARALTATLQFPDVEAQSLVEGRNNFV